jgi:hypothetical protein
LSSKCDKGAGKVNVLTWGDLSSSRRGNPVRESRLRWQGSAEVVVLEFFQEGPNKERDEYIEQFVG